MDVSPFVGGMAAQGPWEGKCFFESCRYGIMAVLGSKLLIPHA